MLCPFAAGAQVADSVDAIDYDLTLDLSSGNRLCGHAVVTLRMLRECATVGLMLEATTDSVKVDGATVADAALWAVPTAGVAAGDTVRVEVWYRTTGYVEPGGWGGLYLGSSLGYNLGVGFASNPHVIGRALFPCRDNFTDKATYTLRVTTKAGWTAECGGTRLSAEVDSAGCEHSVWRIGQPTPTYLVSVSQAAWQRVQDTVASLYGDYPLTLGYRTGTEADVRSAFAELDSVVPMYERCFGPYRWGRIGYIATPKGSMEHVNNIALQSSFATSLSERAQTTIAHELGHAWFGNLLTCTTDADMWINEGGASFCSEVAMESVLGREASDDYYQRNLEAVLRTTHSTDGAYRALHGLPLHLTYGSTTYDKGWMVWHSLRGYLGEEAFYGAMNRLMASCAFGNIDAEGLRDSLSLYTGVDLEDFFRFHVFSPGFVDYHVEMDTPEDGCLSTSPSLHLHQQSVGTDAHVEFNRVPVTFYARPGYDSTVCKRTILFEGTDAYEMTDLPFVPAFCVLDADCELSDAATVACQQTEGEGTLHTLESEHAMVGTRHATTVCVEHHWGKPMGERGEDGAALLDGARRLAARGRRPRHVPLCEDPQQQHLQRSRPGLHREPRGRRLAGAALPQGRHRGVDRRFAPAHGQLRQRISDGWRRCRHTGAGRIHAGGGRPPGRGHRRGGDTLLRTLPQPPGARTGVDRGGGHGGALHTDNPRRRRPSGMGKNGLPQRRKNEPRTDKRNIFCQN